jgi:hypothetical protein
MEIKRFVLMQTAFMTLFGHFTTSHAETRTVAALSTARRRRRNLVATHGLAARASTRVPAPTSLLVPLRARNIHEDDEEVQRECDQHERAKSNAERFLKCSSTF